MTKSLMVAGIAALMVAASPAFANGHLTMKDATVLEIVTFKPNAGVTQEQMTKAAHNVAAILQEFDGYVARSVALADDGTWIDSVYWVDRQSAEAAAEAVMKIPKAGEFFALIDQSTMVFRHAEITTPPR